MKMWGSGGTAPHIPNLSIRCRCIVKFTTWPICPWGKRS